MARYEHLPIYKEAFDLALYFEKTVRNMSRYNKYTLGADLRNLSREVLRLIQRANSEEDRVETLKEVRSKVEELKSVLRLARESGAIQKVLLSPMREELERWREAIGAFLSQHLLLELNERRSRIAPLSSGIDFLDYVTHPRHRLVRRRVVGNLTEKLAALEKHVVLVAGGYNWVVYREGKCEYLEAILSSCRAILQRAGTWRLRRSLRARFPYLGKLCPPPSHKPFWSGARLFPCFAAQAHAFRERFPGSLVLIEVGRFFEVHGPEAEALGRLVRLKVYRVRRGGACRWTRFPVGPLRWFLDRAWPSGIENIVVVREDGDGLGRVLPRRAVACGARADIGKIYPPRDPLRPGRQKNPLVPGAQGDSGALDLPRPDLTGDLEGGPDARGRVG
jgi:hypothetical protein